MHMLRTTATRRDIIRLVRTDESRWKLYVLDQSPDVSQKCPQRSMIRRRAEIGTPERQSDE